MKNTAAIKQKLMEKEQPLCIEGVGLFTPFYVPAALMQGGTEIRPPRFGWYFKPGKYQAAGCEAVTADEAFVNSMQDGIDTGESFEMPGMGLFFLRGDQYEILSDAAVTHRQYGLQSIPLQPRLTKTALQPTLVLKQAGTKLLGLKVAAVVLLLILVNVVIISSLTENGLIAIGSRGGQLSEREALMQAGFIEVDAFSGASYLPDHAMWYDPIVPAVVESTSVSMMAIKAPVLADTVQEYLQETTITVPEVVETSVEAAEDATPSFTPAPFSKTNVAKPARMQRQSLARLPDAVRQYPEEVAELMQLFNRPVLATKEAVEPAIKPVESPVVQPSTAEVVAPREQPAPATPPAPAQNETAAPKSKGIKVVVGAFKESANANAYVRELKNRGFEAEIVGNAGSGLLRVVVVGGDSAASDEFLVKVKAKINQGAWVLAE